MKNENTSKSLKSFYIIGQEKNINEGIEKKRVKRSYGTRKNVSEKLKKHFGDVIRKLASE